MAENVAFSTLEIPKVSLSKVNLNVLFVGRLVDWKALDIAIDAVNNTKTDAKLKVLGDGPLGLIWRHMRKSMHPIKLSF